MNIRNTHTPKAIIILLLKLTLDYGQGRMETLERSFSTFYFLKSEGEASFLRWATESELLLLKGVDNVSHKVWKSSWSLSLCFFKDPPTFSCANYAPQGAINLKLPIILAEICWTTFQNQSVTQPNFASFLDIN